MTVQYSTAGARKNLHNIIKDVLTNRRAVEIIPAAGSEGVAIIPLSDWSAIKETFLLEQSGVMDKVRQREADDSGFTDLNDIDWNKL